MRAHELADLVLEHAKGENTYLCSLNGNLASRLCSFLTKGGIPYLCYPSEDPDWVYIVILSNEKDWKSIASMAERLDDKQMIQEILIDIHAKTKMAGA